MLWSTCILVVPPGSVAKVNSNTNTSSNMNSWDNTHLWWIWANFWRPARFNLWTTMQKTIKTNEKLLTGWGTYHLQLRNCFITMSVCLIETFCTYICNCITVHVIEYPRLNSNHLKIWFHMWKVQLTLFNNKNRQINHYKIFEKHKFNSA
jgi:hypothetical protein